jgi:hypothetical protein
MIAVAAGSVQSVEDGGEMAQVAHHRIGGLGAGPAVRGVRL